MGTKKYEPRERKSGAANGGQAKSTQSGQFSHKFINPYLTEADKQWLVSNMESIDTICLELLHDVGEMYSFSCTYDAKSGRFNAMLKCVATDHGNSGLILSVRGATAIDAMYALAYLHVEKSDGLWLSIAPETNVSSERWG